VLNCISSAAEGKVTGGGGGGNCIVSYNSVTQKLVKYSNQRNSSVQTVVCVT
jgi:mevalonate kinase